MLADIILMIIICYRFLVNAFSQRIIKRLELLGK